MAFKISTLINKLLQQPIEINNQGNQMHSVFWRSERYAIDFAKDYAESGFQQFDTDHDAHYFGVWVNPKTYQVLTYLEGDWTLVVCNGPERYNREIQGCINFYDEGYIAKNIDENGDTTFYRQDRSKFLLDT
jgi:hypothetical protein